MNKIENQNTQPQNLRYGYTTGACATAATLAAYTKLITGNSLNPVQIKLPRGQKPLFNVEFENSGANWTEVGIIKDAGDDPDVTNGATIISKVSLGQPDSGITFQAGEGVGTVTRAGLPINVGEPAINPIPRQMMMTVIRELAARFKVSPDAKIEISIPNGEKIAKKTMNARLGILGGLSILGTTGIVKPFSCSSWIASIHLAIDVARSANLKHVAGTTGSVSEAAVQNKYNLTDQAMLDMGDFVGGLLKYIRTKTIPKLTIAGGPAKMTKLAQGELDLHSSRSSVDPNFVTKMYYDAGGNADSEPKLSEVNTIQNYFDVAHKSQIPIANFAANIANLTVRKTLRDAKIETNVLIINRSGDIIGASDV